VTEEQKAGSSFGHLVIPPRRIFTPMLALSSYKGP
jgi:hypothetical protein